MAVLGGEQTDALQGEVLEADFTANTLTFKMHGDYYARAGTYIILPLSDYNALKSQADARQREYIDRIHP